MDKKIWTYLCAGCGIGKAFDVEALSQTIAGEFKLAGCATHPCLCGDEGLARIRADLADAAQAAEGAAVAQTVVIAACSPRVNTDVFGFGSDVMVERVSLREHVAWRRAPDEDAADTQMLAEDVTRMGIARAQTCELPEPFIGTISNSAVLVVGGGVAGLTAALACARTGCEVVLVEKEARLGGWLNRLHARAPSAPPYRELEAPGVDELVKAATEHPSIKIHASAEIEKISGQPGMFDVTIKRDGATEIAKIGAIVLATGFRPYDANKLGHLGYGNCANVVTQEAIERMAKDGRIARPSDGRPAKKIAFIQCAGSRDPAHLPYCSTTCCMTSLKQALDIRHHAPAAQVFIFYKDIRTPAQYESFYKRVQEDPGVCLTKGDVKSVVEDSDKGLLVQVDNALLGEAIELKVDLVVLATGMVPATLDAETLHLEYRQGGDAPVDKYGFPNSNFICFPYETRRTGIYAAGCVRQPMDAAAAATDATGAALKAIQCIEMTSAGAAVHPRAGDLSYPIISFERCTQCKRCTEECPFGALNEDAKGTPQTNPNRCRRCGICMGACPERIVNFANYNVHMISSMVKAVHVPDEFEEKPRVLVLVCENDAYPAFDIAASYRLAYSPYVRLIPVRCLGSINVVWIKDALSKGYDGILMIGCKHGDDYQCHFITGSELLTKRSENIQEALTSMALETERIQTEQLALTEYERLPGLIGKFMETIEAVGPNPFKGM